MYGAPPSLSAPGLQVSLFTLPQILGCPLAGHFPGIPGIAHKTTRPSPAPWDTYRDVLQRGVNDLIVVRKAVKLESVEVEEDVVAELDAVDVGVRL